MKKTYRKPEVVLTTINNTILAGSTPQLSEGINGAHNMRSRYKQVEWIDEEEDF